MTVVLVGATATGKSGLAVALARAYAEHGHRAEVVNADSMLVYRGLDIGTAKPRPDERQGVPHHLIDILDVAATATVAEFQAAARTVIDDCRARGAVPIVVGGSALYIRAILDDFTFPGTDAAVRARWSAELERVGAAALHAQLGERDPAAAGSIQPANGRRIVRALEVIELTGRPYPATLPPWRYALPDVVQIGLWIDRPELDRRIAARIEQMWADGLVEEVRGLLDRGLADGVTASRALGYAQVLAHLDGRLSEDEARRQTVAATRRFARRQDGWFRRDPRISWVLYDHPDLVAVAYGLAGPTGTGSARVPD